MSRNPVDAGGWSGLALALSLLAACGGGGTPPATSATTAPVSATPGTPAVAPPADLTAATQQAAQTLEANATSWTPEALEDLLAPVALYPDAVLAQLLVAVTNPQEVLDAGNWLIANPDLSGKALDEAAEKVGFTTPTRALVQFPEVVDQLCTNLDWTAELGQAYVNDQQGVMDAVQRLRVQAQDAGNLQSSPQMKVETRQEPGQPEIVTVSPPSPQVVYVPQYDPQAVYAPPPAAATTPSTATTPAAESKDAGHSTGSLVATGLLAFGAGMLVNEIFDDDDDDYWNNSYYGNMWYRPMPYYPPYPYRPAYGSGFYPGSAYQRPPTYIRGGNTVIVNNQNNNYYNRYKGDQIAKTRAQPRSPITSARPNRPELQQLNAKATQGPVRKAPASSEAWKGKGGYAGNDPAVRKSLDQQAARGQRTQDTRARDAAAATKAGASRPATAAARPTPTVNGKPPAPKLQGSYAGAKPERPRPATAEARPAANRPAVSNREQARPDVDRGRPAPVAASRPTASPGAPQAKPQRPQSANQTAVARSGSSAKGAKAASDRGKKSMPSGSPKKRGGR
jgi:hypothetical protein